MLNIMYAAAALLLLWCFVCLLLRRMRPLPGQQGQMTVQKGLLPVGLTGAAFFGALTIGLTAATGLPQWVLLAFLALSAFLVQGCCLWRIRWTAEGFEARGMFGRRRWIPWPEITGLNDEALVTAQGAIGLEPEQPGCADFMAAACGALDVPALPYAVTPGDPFRGQLKRPMQLLMSYLLVPALWLGLAAWLGVMVITGVEPELTAFLGWSAAACALAAALFALLAARVIRIGREPERCSVKVVERWIGAKHFRTPPERKDESEC